MNTWRKFVTGLKVRSMQVLVTFVYAIASSVMLFGLVYAIWHRDWPHTAGCLLGIGALPFIPFRRTTSENILRAPGATLRPIAYAIFSKRTFEGVIEPALIEPQSEWLEAHTRNDVKRARWIVIRGTWSVLVAMVAQVPISGLRILQKIRDATKL
jgi:hypothetical protein